MGASIQSGATQLVKSRGSFDRNIPRDTNVGQYGLFTFVVIGGLHMTSSKHDYANYDQFAPNFDMVCKTVQRVSVPNLKLFGPIKTELWTKEVGTFSIM